MRVGLSAKRLCFVVAALSLLPSAAIAQVQINQTFIPQGPSPGFGPLDTTGSADANDGKDGTNSGAVQAILLDPMLGADTMFIGSTNGGIWITTDAGATWKRLTDNFASLSIASLALNSTDPTGMTLIAGIGVTTSGNWGPAIDAGARPTGLLLSTDGGQSWTQLEGDAFKNQSVIGVAAFGSRDIDTMTILAATFEAQHPNETETSDGVPYGLYISTNGGKHFDPVSGLPAGPVTSLVAADPSDPSNMTFYAAVKSDPGHQGVYVTTDGGTSWTQVFSVAGVIQTNDAVVLKLAAGPNDALAIAAFNAQGQTLAGLYLSENALAQNPSWSALQNLLPDVNSMGDPSGVLHSAVAIDPNSPPGSPIVYLAGWDASDEAGIWAYSVQGQTVTSLTCTVTNGQCAPGTDGILGTAHADARAFVIDAAGNLLMGSDGGVYKLLNPQNTPQGGTPTWTGLNTSTLQVREPFQVGYGANAHRLVVAAQDNGVAIQSAPNSARYNSVQRADGHVAVVSDTTFPNLSVYYTSTQSLDDLARVILDSNGEPVSPLGPTPAGIPVTCQLPGDAKEQSCGDATGPGKHDDTMVLNKVDQTLIALSNGFDIYVAKDTAPASATSVNLMLTDLGPSTGSQVRHALAYGAIGNPNLDVLLAGGTDSLYWTTTADPGSLNPVQDYQTMGGQTPTSVAFGVYDQSLLPQYHQHFYVADSTNLWAGTLNGTPSGGATVTLQPPLLLPEGLISPTSVEFINHNGVEALLVGGLMHCVGSDGTCDPSQSPIAVADSDNSGNLTEFRNFGSRLPNALVYQMSYNPLADVLAVASVGRGVWTLYDVTSYFKQATALQFGLANNDSIPDASHLTDGTHLDGTTFVRALEKYGTGTLVVAGDASFTGGTTIFGGILQLGIGGTSGAILGDVGFCSDAANPLCHAGADKFLVFDRSDSYTFAGAISGPGQLVQGGPGTTILTGVSTYSGPSYVNSGTLAVNGSITSSVFVNGGATLAGTGMVGSTRVDTAGTLSPGNGIGTTGTLKVAGDLVFEPGSLYLTTVAGSKSSRTRVTGTATLAGTAVSLFQPGSLTNSYTILSTASGRFGTFDTFTPIGLPSFVSAALGYTATDVTLDLTSQIAGVDGLTRNQHAVGAALDHAFNSGRGIPDNLNAALFSLPASELPSALDALSGEAHATTSSVLLDQSRYERDAILGRMIQAGYGRGSGQVAALGASNSIAVASLNKFDGQAMSLGPGDAYVPPPAPDLAFWTRGFGAWANFDGNGNAASAARQLGGFVSGMDAGVGDGWRIGAATGFSQSSINVARHSSADVDTVYLAGYAGGNFGPIALRSGGSWGWHDIDTSRFVVFPGFSEKEEASYRGDTGQVFGEAAYPMLMGSAAVEPFAGLAFVRVNTNSFHERGGVASLRGAGEDEDVGYSTLGLRAATTWHLSDLVVTPHVSAAWQHAFGDLTSDAALVLSSMGTGFVVAGVPLAQNSALIDAGFDLNLRPAVTLGFSYSGQFANNLQDNAVNGRFTWLF